MHFANLVETGARSINAAPPSLCAPETVRIVITEAGGAYLETTDQGERVQAPFAPDADAATRLRRSGVERVDLILEEGACLDMAFVLPEATLADMRAMIETEVAFQSPVSLSEALWCWTAERRRSGDEPEWHIEVALTLASRLVPLLDALRDAGVAIALVRRRRPDGEWAARPDWLRGDQPGKSRLERLGQQAQTLPALVLVPIAASALFALVCVQQGLSVLVSQGAIADDARAARTTVAQALEQSSRRRALEDEGRLSSLRLATIPSVAAALPDDTWLDSLSIDGTEFELSGFGPSAARTTEDLAKVQGLNALRFAAPIARNSRQKTERFRIAGYLDDLPRASDQ
ncbi:MAG: PilN domain-containing protein [Pseudomonadota bacterium]